MKLDRFMIAAERSGSGKTTITLGLLAALRKRGLKARPYKVGPDYLDCTYHRSIAGVDSYNLDSWMLDKDYLVKHFVETSWGFDISVVEGVMGLFDGSGDGIEGSSAEISIILDIPIVLVVDCYAISESVAPLVYGFANYDKRVKISGVILNNVAGKRHLDFLLKAIKKVNIPVIGYLFRNDILSFKSRHLGLVSSFKDDVDNEKIQKIANLFEENINIDLLLKISSIEFNRISAPKIENIKKQDFKKNILTGKKECKLAIAYDRAFHFYYSANIDLLKEYGAEIIFFSPLGDKKLPSDVSGIYLGGGYPEIYAKNLAENVDMIGSLKNFAENGGLIYAECGGLMYLGRSIKYMGEIYQMVNIFGIDFEVSNKLSSLRYAEIELIDDTIIGKKGMRVRGHEFHYSIIRNKEIYSDVSVKKVYKIINSEKYPKEVEGFSFKNVLASYIHLHFGSNIDTARNIVYKCKSCI